MRDARPVRTAIHPHRIAAFKLGMLTPARVFSVAGVCGGAISQQRGESRQRQPPIEML